MMRIGLIALFAVVAIDVAIYMVAATDSPIKTVSAVNMLMACIFMFMACFNLARLK